MKARKPVNQFIFSSVAPAEKSPFQPISKNRFDTIGAMNTKSLIAKMPSCLFSGYDPMRHKTVGDLAYLAQFELDLFEEGEDSDIKTKAQYAQVKKWMGALPSEEVTP